ncbi:MAG: MFS transporter, partial [Acidimicrobiia bacterium]
MLTALIAVIASVSGLNVAQQGLAIDLGASQGTVLWIINAYTLALAALLMPIGAIGDRWGRKPVLMAGLVLFGLAAVVAAIAPSAGVMIAARVAAGAGAAMIMPVTLSVITSSFPPEERARAIGLWAGFAGSGGMIGLFVSAFMVDVLDWRWTFVLPIVLSAVSLAVTALHVPNSREGAVHPFDTGGSVLSALAIGGLVLGIHEGPEKGWGHPL